MHIWVKTQETFVDEKSILEDHIEAEFRLHSLPQNTEKRLFCISQSLFVPLTQFPYEMGYDATNFCHKHKLFPGLL